MMMVSFLVRQNVVVKVDCFFSTVKLMSKIAELLSDYITTVTLLLLFKAHTQVC